MIKPRYGLVFSSEVFEPSQYTKDGFLLIGFSIDIANQKLNVVYENLKNGSVKSESSQKFRPGKIAPVFQCYLFDKKDNKVNQVEFNKEHFDLDDTTNTYFNKFSILQITKGFNELIFSPCTITLGYSYVSTKNNLKFCSLKCQGRSPKNSSIARLPISGGSGSSQENGSNTTNGQPTPPEYNP